MMYKGIKCKIYPNQQQKDIIEMTFGHTRFVWNEMLNMINERYRNNPSLHMLKKKQLSVLLTQLKKEHTWLKDVDSVAVQCSVLRLSETFDRFFNKQNNYPKFKSKKRVAQSYTSTIRGNNIRFNHNQRYIKLPKLNWVKCRSSFKHIENQRIKSVTVKRKSTGRYEIALIVECDNQTLPQTGQSIGVDLGLTDLAILSNGKRFKSQKLHLKYRKQLHYWEKRRARRLIQAKKNGVNLSDAINYQKANQQVARIHEKIKNTRKDYIHKVTTYLVENFDIIVIEDLKVRKMLKNHQLARHIANESWYDFKTILQYKCDRYGKELIVINPYKTSQICSNCGYDSGKKSLDIRKWTCQKCHKEHDRDINASKNILNIGLERALVK